MKEQDFQAKLSALLEQIDDLPQEQREHLSELAEQTKARHEKVRKTMSSLQESLDYLRVSVKYLMFDLEATRRENKHLRDMLEGDTGFNQNNNFDAS